MAKNISKVKEIDVGAVAGNKTLAAAMDRRTVDRCKEAIEKLGVVHTPVVGAAKDGRRLLLSGQSELTALRELGVKKMDAIEVDVAGDVEAKAKLSLLLMSLWDRPGALCEGLLLQEALGDGSSRLELQTMLGKSASWISNRLALVTRLDGNVFEMVKNGMLEPRSAQEVARLPAGAQFAFAETAVREGLPKSAVELLVAGYNAESCPDAVKAQILSDPRAALKRMADKRRAANATQTRHKGGAPPDVIGGIIKSARLQMGALLRMLCGGPPFEAGEHLEALKALKAELLDLLAIVSKSVSQGWISPGKTAALGTGVDHSG
jgi:ParB-like chromosome segregation protein Spo0J